MAYVAFRVMVHETVLNWHEQNVERDKKAQAFVEETDVELVDNAYAQWDW